MPWALPAARRFDRTTVGQKLFGNVGYRIIEANIEALLATPRPDQASWC